MLPLDRAQLRRQPKRVSLELGGKSPNIIFSDADLDIAIAGSTWAIFSNNGQSCTAGSRMYIERPVYERVLDGLIAECSNITIGPALATDRPDLGPLVSSEHLESVEGWLEEASTGGVQTASGGARPAGVPDGGYYLAPPSSSTETTRFLSAARRSSAPSWLPCRSTTSMKQ